MQGPSAGFAPHQYSTIPVWYQYGTSYVSRSPTKLQEIACTKVHVVDAANEVLVVIVVQSGLGGSRGFPWAIISEARQGRGNVRQPSSVNQVPRRTVALISWGSKLVLVRTS